MYSMIYSMHRTQHNTQISFLISDQHTSTKTALLASVNSPMRPCDIGRVPNLAALLQPSFCACSFSQAIAYLLG